MSNDLISRSALLEEINNFSMRITSSVNATAITIMEETKKSIAKMIDEQPTAYDLDKVMERLEELRETVPVNRLLDDIIKDKPKELGQLMAYRKAIEIVKSGGIE
ncbi:hypothetical protein AALA79_01845 [Lachnospiraceae bacterium 64-25]